MPNTPNPERIIRSIKCLITSALEDIKKAEERIESQKRTVLNWNEQINELEKLITK